MDPIEAELDKRIASARTRLAKLRELEALETAIEGLAAEVLLSKAFLRVMLKEITLIVCAKMGVTPKEIRSPLRGMEQVADARQIVMFIARNRGLGSASEIGKQMGRDHGTILHAVKAVSEKMATRPSFKLMVDEIVAAVDSRMKDLNCEPDDNSENEAPSVLHLESHADTLLKSQA